MANRSAAGSTLIHRRTVLQVAAALAAAGPALMREGHTAARPPVVIDAQVHAYAANTQAGVGDGAVVGRAAHYRRPDEKARLEGLGSGRCRGRDCGRNRRP
jgi:hypothetical protein